MEKTKKKKLTRSLDAKADKCFTYQKEQGHKRVGFISVTDECRTT